MADAPDTQVLADWQQFWNAVNDEYIAMVGAVDFSAGSLSVNQKNALDMLERQKAMAENMINRLGGAVPGSSNIQVRASAERY